jgi:CRP-like cAMP-binding protein
MAQDECAEMLRKYIVSLNPVHENSLRILVNSFSSFDLGEGQFLTQSGAYPTHFAFVCTGVMHAFYSDLKGKAHTQDFFGPHHFVLPMPSFIQRKPSSLNFQAITPCSLLVLKYTEIETLARNHSSIRDFLRVLIEREWIIRKSMLESSQYFFNVKTRYRMLTERLGNDLNKLPAAHVASFLRVSEKQLSRFIS